MQSTSPSNISDQTANIRKAEVVWVVNPFDQLPNETDVPLRYWTLCRTLAELGYEVTWWSSNFSHLSKSKRIACPPTDGFNVRLIETPTYTKNISLARLSNHHRFAKDFYQTAMDGLQSGEIASPNRIVVSLPPIGVAEQAFRIRDYVRNADGVQAEITKESGRHKLQKNTQSSQPKTPNSRQTTPCEVCLDIMDAWPETFYQVIPNPLGKVLGPLLFAPFHSSVKRAYLGADKISAAGRSYLDLAKQYLANEDTPRTASHTTHNSSSKPMHLCYHGTDLRRFEVQEQRLNASEAPKRAIYLGALEQGYDLHTIIHAARKWKETGSLQWQIHFAGDGSSRKTLEAMCADLIDEKRVIFHGYLQKDATSELLLSCDLALVPNRPRSLVACPYKAGEYAAAGLPIITCLGGELSRLLLEHDAGSEYKEGDVDSLDAAFADYLQQPDLLSTRSQNIRRMAVKIFDQSETYQELARFITC